MAAIFVVAVIAVVVGTAVHRWSTSDAVRDQRLHDELSALPGVAEVTVGPLEQEIRLAEGVTVEQARAASSAVGEGRWKLVLDPAETTVYGEDDKTDTRAVDVLVLAGSAGLVDEYPGDRTTPAVWVQWDPRAHGVTVYLTHPYTDLLGWTTTLVETFAEHRGLVPAGITITGGSMGPLASAETLSDLDVAREELAAVSELADLDPRFSLDGARRRVVVEVPSRDELDATWKRVRTARSHAPDGLDVVVLLDGRRVDDPRSV